MRKLTAVAAALALTGLAACDTVQPGAPAATAIPRTQAGPDGPAVNPALLPASAFQGAPTAGTGVQQGPGGPAINPATVPAARAAGGTPTAGTGVQQGEGGRPAINPATIPANRFPSAPAR